MFAAQLISAGKLFVSRGQGQLQDGSLGAAIDSYGGELQLGGNWYETRAPGCLS